MERSYSSAVALTVILSALAAPTLAGPAAAAERPHRASEGPPGGSVTEDLAAVDDVPGVGIPLMGLRRTTRPVRVSDDRLPPVGGEPPAAQSEPHLAIDPEDRDHLVAAWQESFVDAHHLVWHLAYAVSQDAGRTWVEDVVPGLTQLDGGPWDSARGAWVAAGPAGRVYCASSLEGSSESASAVAVSVSTDGGFSWEPPVEVFRSDAADVYSKRATVAVDAFPGSSYYGRVYVTWNIDLFSHGSFVDQPVVVARSTDGGATWRARQLRDRGANVGAIPQVGPDGTVYVVWAGGPVAGTPAELTAIYFSKSTNGGRRWSRPQVIAEDLSVGVPQLRSGSSLPSFAVDRSTGALYVAWPDARWTLTDQATLVVSHDGGESWSPPRRVGDDPDDAAAFTVTVAAAGGQVALSYFSLRNDPGRHYLADEYITRSTDGGGSFGPSARVTRRSFDVRFARQLGGPGDYFLGDYQGLVAGEGGFHLLWVDTHRYSSEAMSRQPDVWAARTRR